MEDNEFQLQEFKNVKSTNTDLSDRIFLESTRKNLINYDIINSVNVAEQFEIERQNTLNYRVYGGIEYFSLLNNIVTGYTTLTNFFTKIIKTTPVKNITDSFDIYLLKPYTAYTELTTEKFVRMFQVIATPNELDIVNAGFSKNIFFEQESTFIFSKSFETYNLVDGFGKPITEFYLYFNYKSGKNGFGTSEVVSRRSFDALSDESTFNKLVYPSTGYTTGDVIYGDLVRYQKENFLETLLADQQYYVSVPYDSPTKNIILTYNPFIKIKIRDFDSQINFQNLSATTVETIIPSYAVNIDSDGNYLWKDILDFGVIDPLENLGVNFPFVNGAHYVHGIYILSMSPDMTDTNTAAVFEEILFAQNQTINATPITGLNNAGNIC